MERCTVFNTKDLKFYLKSSFKLFTHKGIMMIINFTHLPTIIYIVVFFAIFIQITHCIDCFKCVSYNGENRACDDPFHNNFSTAVLESPCMGGRKGRDGLFPATACIKIAGQYDDTGETITVRGCALDSGTLTTDTEIIRMSHCGKFYYEDRYVHGCLQSCDSDACNTASSIINKKSKKLLHLVLSVVFSLFIPYNLS